MINRTIRLIFTMKTKNSVHENMSATLYYIDHNKIAIKTSKLKHDDIKNILDFKIALVRVICGNNSNIFFCLNRLLCIRTIINSFGNEYICEFEAPKQKTIIVPKYNISIYAQCSGYEKLRLILKTKNIKKYN